MRRFRGDHLAVERDRCGTLSALRNRMRLPIKVIAPLAITVDMPGRHLSMCVDHAGHMNGVGEAWRNGM